MFFNEEADAILFDDNMKMSIPKGYAVELGGHLDISNENNVNT